MPVSGKTITGLADKIIKHYSDYRDIKDLQRANLLKCLKANGAENAVIKTEY